MDRLELFRLVHLTGTADKEPQLFNHVTICSKKVEKGDIIREMATSRNEMDKEE